MFHWMVIFRLASILKILERLIHFWLVVTGTMELFMTFHEKLGMENHPN
jgi:hypothetical protein